MSTRSDFSRRMSREAQKSRNWLSLNHIMQALTSTLDLDEVLTLVLERGWTLQQDLQSNLPL